MIRMKTLWQNLLALFIGCVITLTLAEIVVRLFPHKFIQYLPLCKDIEYQKDKDVGYTLLPNQKATYCNDCFRIYPIRSNSLGFRDDEWENKPGFKIAVLGDSNMMSMEVAEDSSTPGILEKILNREVLNSAVGGRGTITQVLIYKKFLRPFKPNVVILFFTEGNDIHDNSCELTKMLHYSVSQPCGYMQNGKIKIETNFECPEAKSIGTLSARIKEFIKRHCLSCVAINRFRFKALYRITHRRSLRSRNMCYWQLYCPARTKVWQDAWKITEKALVDLKREVEPEASNFLVVTVPDSEFIKPSDTWEKELKREMGLREIPKDFDPLYPTRRLRNICRRHNILFLELEPYFQRYRDKFNLKYPYFSYRCDPHFNPLGHFLVSYVVARYLIEQNWIPLTDIEKTKLLKKIEQDLNLSPLQILGTEAYRQIYHRGVYLGSSNINKILEDN